MRTNDDGETLATQLELRAKGKGISINRLCRQASIARSTFSRWKAGTTEPTVSVYRRLSQTLDDMQAYPPRA